jgi:aryl-alcohol dehydrogenase-like predicted oxidoreductase
VERAVHAANRSVRLRSVIHNIFDQAPDDELLPASRELDVAVIARVLFDEGTLTGSLTTHSRWPDNLAYDFR